MTFDLEDIAKKALEEVDSSKGKEEPAKLRIKYFGRKSGILPKITQEIPNLSAEERAGVGTKIKEVRSKIEQALAAKEQSNSLTKTTEATDITTPGKKIEVGTLHPLTKVLNEVKEIFHYLGFTFVEGPEVDIDLYNFQKLNMPPNHPARDVQQTYYISKRNNRRDLREDDYIDNELLLRTHTSNMQVRYLENHKPPVRVLFPGRCYRRDMPDATHFPSFYQVEGLAVDKTISMTDLLGSLDFFVRSFFGEKTKMRAYGHHFPYTEPSIEIEIHHPTKGWLEILGAGMVHPAVLNNGGVDLAKYRGFAFGMGVERLAMLKYGIDDIRILFENDLRFLNQF